MLLALWCFWTVPVFAADLPAIPSGYAAELSLAWSCYTNGDYSNSLAHYETALRRAPQSLDARLGRLLPLLALERFAEAEQSARGVLREFPGNYYASLRLALALRRQRQFAAAEAVLNEALRLRPADVPLLLELALVEQGRRQFATAQRLFLDVVTLDPANATARRELSAPEMAGTTADEPIHGGEFGVLSPLRFEVATYYAFVNYHDTAAKDHSQVEGLYGSLGLGPAHRFEAEADYLNKSYRGLTSLRQWDATVTYANFSLPNWDLRSGGHYVMSQDPFTDEGWVVFGGVERYEPGAWAVGLDGYFTSYPRFQNHLQALQLTPRVDLTLFRRGQIACRTELRGYWIHLNHAFDGRQDLCSLEDRLSLSWRRWTFSLFGWAGEQLFPVRNDGFTVFNLGERHEAGYGLEVRYNLCAHASLTLRAEREEFVDTSTTPHASSETLLAVLTVPF